MKKTLLHGLLAGLLASLAAIIYNIIYKRALMTDFSEIITLSRLLGFNLLVCLFASIGYYYFSRIVHRNTDLWFNIVFIILTFAAFMPAFLVSLPLDIQSPEMFVGLAIPMLLFPLTFWLVSKPIYWK